MTAVGGANIFNLLHARKYVTPVRVSLSDVGKHIRPVMVLFLMTLFINLFTQIDSTMVGMMKNDSAVGLYAAGDKMSSLVSGVIGAVSMVSLPRISFYHESGQEDKLLDLIVKTVNAVLMFAIPSSVGICLLGEPIVLLFSGASFSAAAITIKILSLRVLLSPLNAIFVLYIFIPLRKERYSMFVTAVAAVTNFIVNLFLIPVLSYNGAAAATVLAEAVELVFVIVFAGRLLPVKKIFSGVWQYMAACLSVPAVWISVDGITGNYIVNMLLIISGSMIVYFGILLALKNDYILHAIKYIKQEVCSWKN